MILRLVKYCFISAAVIIFLGCSGRRVLNKSIVLSVKPVELNAWINLMPGSSASFYLSGKLKLINNSQDTVRNIRFENISVYQGSSKIYEFVPVVVFRNNSRAVLSLDSVNVSFKNNKGLPAGSKIDLKKNVDILMTVSFNSGKKEFGFNDIKVEKVY